MQNSTLINFKKFACREFNYRYNGDGRYGTNYTREARKELKSKMKRFYNKFN